MKQDVKKCCFFFSYLPQQEGVKTENNDHINLKVAGQDGSVVQFKIKRHTPLSKLMKAYCERQVWLLCDHQENTGGEMISIEIDKTVKS